MKQHVLSDVCGVAVEDCDYDRGYWSRVAGLPCPRRPRDAVTGWRDADRELSDEAATAAKEAAQ